MKNPNKLPPDIEGIRETLFDIVTDPPCHRGLCYEFWDAQGHYCFLKDMHENTKKCELINESFFRLTEHGVVVLDKDQSKPSFRNAVNKSYNDYMLGQEDMIADKFRKVINLDGTPVKEG